MNTTTDMNAIHESATPPAAPIQAGRDTTDRRTREDKPSREEKLDAARAVLEAGLADVQDDPEALAAFLAFHARFHDYSLSNAVLIWCQRPSARHCMGYRAWQKHGRQVRKGERGLTILAPVTRKRTEGDVAAGADPAAANGDGERSVVGYRAATVFDYAQTDAAKEGALTYVPPAPRLDASDPDGLAQALASVAGAIGYAVQYDEAGYADGRCSFARRQIRVNPTLSPADRAAVLCHELAHALAHDPRDRVSGDPGITTEQREIQAEGAAFVALAALGLDTARASLPYLKGWAGSDHEVLRRELAAIDRIARDLLDRVEASASEPEDASAEA